MNCLSNARSLQIPSVTGRAVVLVSFCLVLLCSLPGPASASTPEPPERPAGYVEDLAKVLSPEAHRQLNAHLLELEQKTTAQVMILTVRKLDGEDIAGFTLRIAEKWKPGQKGKDNGVLITVAVEDRKYRIEVGYGLESILPDSLVGSIGREHLVPYFRKGDYGAGLISATSVIARTIASSQGVELTGLPQPQRPARQKEQISPVLFYALLFLAFGAVPFLWNLLLTKRRVSGRGSSYGNSGVWWGGGGFGGSGSGGFDSGGFGGGGGGSFGGGGASGDW